MNAFSKLIAQKKPIVIYAEKSSMRRLFSSVLSKYYIQQAKVSESEGETRIGEQVRVFSSEGHLGGISDNFINKIKCNHKYRITQDNFAHSVEVANHPLKKSRLKKLQEIIKAVGQDAIWINATDAGREGQLIYYIGMLLGYGKDKSSFLNSYDKQYRLWLDSTDETSIKKSFDELKENKAYSKLTQEAISRCIFDWNVGMVSSIYFTKKTRNLSTLGRVQTPTLQLIVNRHKEVQEQKDKKEEFFLPFIFPKAENEKVPNVKIMLSEGEDVKYTKKTEASSKLLDFASKIKAKGLTALLELASVKTNEKRYYEKHSLLNLTKLQAKLQKKKNISLNEWMAHIQRAYDKGYITYPRTDSEYLPSALEEEVDSVLQYLCRGKMASLKNKGKEYLYDDKKISDHYAIILTKKFTFDLLSSEDEYVKIILSVVFENMIECFFPKEVVNFSASGVVKEVFTQFSIDEKISLFENGLSVLSNDDKEVVSIEYQSIDFASICASPNWSIGIDVFVPKKKQHFTEIGLAQAMARMEMGTPATRDTGMILESLYRSNYIVSEKGRVIPTEKGISVIERLKNTLFTDVEFSILFEKSLNSSIEQTQNMQEELVGNFFGVLYEGERMEIYEERELPVGGRIIKEM